MGNVIPMAFHQMINICSHYLNKRDNKNNIQIHPTEKHTHPTTLFQQYFTKSLTLSATL